MLLKIIVRDGEYLCRGKGNTLYVTPTVDCVHTIYSTNYYCCLHNHFYWGLLQGYIIKRLCAIYDMCIKPHNGSNSYCVLMIFDGTYITTYVVCTPLEVCVEKWSVDLVLHAAPLQNMYHQTCKK